MPRKKIKEVIEDETEVLETIPEKIKPTPENKIRAEVYSIGKCIYLKDAEGHGYSLPIKKEHKNVKIGDTLYI